MPNETTKARRSSRISPYHEDSSSFFNIASVLEKHKDTQQINTDLEKGSYIPPWTEPYIIGIAGNSGSGKTSLSQKIIQEINQPWTVLLSFDNFYNPLSKEERQKAFSNEFDFDTPDSLDLDLLYKVVKSLKSGEKTEIPIYSFTKHDRTDKTTTIYGANVIVIEGIYALYDQRLLDLMDIKIYVDTDLDICLARRLTRDILYRGRDLSGAMKQWETFVKPNAVRYVNPTMDNANLVIPRGLDNSIAINLMIKHIQKQLALKSSLHLQSLKSLGMNEFKIENYGNLNLLPNNNHTRGINSALFNISTERSDFIFYFDRVAILIIENAIETFKNYRSKTVNTAGNYQYQGLDHVDEIFAINIIRSGDCFMNSIKKTFPEISIGKLLIQSAALTGEPQLHFETLPPNLDKIEHKTILLFDAQIISGAAAIMAIQVLLDHKVRMEDIVFCTYLSTEIGLRRILNVFPRVRIVIGKLSTIDDSTKWYNPESFKDTDWCFRNRFIDSLYFGT